MIFRYTILYVDDVAESLAFFSRAFGFEQLFLHEGGDYGELSTGDTKLAFSSTELMRQLGKNPLSADAAHPTFELAFETDDVASDLNRAIEAGATLVQDVREEPWGQTTSYVSDPNGYLIEICSKVQLLSPD
ncbi:MAG: VOC family protein [Granulosicoccus sp.]|nr:VOC family protein [Granulosicoccus sp.]